MNLIYLFLCFVTGILALYTGWLGYDVLSLYHPVWAKFFLALLMTIFLAGYLVFQGTKK